MATSGKKLREWKRANPDKVRRHAADSRARQRARRAAIAGAATQETDIR